MNSLDLFGIMPQHVPNAEAPNLSGGNTKREIVREGHIYGMSDDLPISTITADCRKRRGATLCLTTDKITARLTSTRDAEIPRRRHASDCSHLRE
jgi:hypothetical protein